jgi:hypothetical protein
MALEAAELLEELLYVVCRKKFPHFAASATHWAIWREAEIDQAVGDLFERIVLEVPVR